MSLRFAPTELSAEELRLQADVRDFLREELPKGSYEPGLGMGARRDAEFSKRLAERGWVGMALPKKYGGHDRTAVDRFIVVEELLRWGAPVGHHWVADRQTGSVILKFGTEEQRERFLPAICRGEVAFSIGMSEPDSGSDLASVSTRATRADDGWLLNGTKIWTSGAHENDWFVVLCRTSPIEDGNKHQGLSQLLVDLHSDGIEVSPIPFLDGSHHFNEVVLTDVFVPTSSSSARSAWAGPRTRRRWPTSGAGPTAGCSSYLLVEEYVRCFGDDPLPDRAAEIVGSITARFWGLRNMSLSVARLIDTGGAPSVESALVKEMGTRFEQDIVLWLTELLDLEPSPGSAWLFERMLASATLTGPSFTIRGGTVEILRSVAAKGLGA